MKRLAFLFAGGALWLVAAAIPVLADGGPHVASINNGSTSGGLTADTCAGCHRAHTAQAANLLKADGTALCLSCHGTTGTGATTNVADGVQYALAAAGGDTLRGAELGALRGGGFVTARIDSANPARQRYALPTAGRSDKEFIQKVGVLAVGQAVTSKHMSLTGGTSTAWGNGAFGGTANPGATGVTLECTSCHNPHGNGQYRILNPIPAPTGGTGFVAAGTGVNVTDAALPGPGDARNYTVIQAVPGSSTDARFLLASEVAAAEAAGTFTNLAGDYFHRKVPWNAKVGDSNTTKHDAPNGVSAYFNGQINAWCAACHSRYTTSADGSIATPPVAGNLSAPNPDGSTTQPMVTSSGDAIFTYRHTTSRNRNCTTCHVSHGSNAAMTGFNSTHQAYPGAGSDPTVAANADSRLLKVDNRGTCVVCHDPTYTIAVDDYTGPLPTPAIP